MSMSPGGPFASGSGSGSISGSAFPTSGTGFRYPSASGAGSGGMSSQFGNSFMSPTSPTSSLAMDETFTAKMRDRQARGKDPYGSEDGSDGSGMSDGETSTSKMRLGGGRGPYEDHGARERRERAQGFLDNPELLMMYAQSTGLTIPGARLHFMKILCGFDDESKSERKKKNIARWCQHRQSSRHEERRTEDRSTTY